MGLIDWSLTCSTTLCPCSKLKYIRAVVMSGATNTGPKRVVPKVGMSFSGARSNASNMSAILSPAKKHYVTINGIEEPPVSKNNAAAQEWTVQGVRIKHKFSEPITVDVVIKGGGMGNHRFFVMKFTRSTPPECMAVSDRNGRIVHATHALANFLGTSPFTLMNNGQARALEAMLPQPFALMHRTLGATVPPPNIQPPPYSCRANISVTMQTRTRDGPTHQPMRITVKKKELGTEQLNVMIMKPVSFEDALKERRLPLLLDRHGRVLKLGSTESDVFGFDPNYLLGRTLGSVVDVFREAEDALAAAAAIDAASATVSAALAEAEAEAKEKNDDDDDEAPAAPAKPTPAEEAASKLMTNKLLMCMAAK